MKNSSNVLNNHMKASISDRPSTFYDRVLSEEFKKRFHIELSEKLDTRKIKIENDDVNKVIEGTIESENDEYVLIKKKKK